MRTSGPGNTPGVEDNGFDRPYRRFLANMELFRRSDGPPFERARTAAVLSGGNVENRAGRLSVGNVENRADRLSVPVTPVSECRGLKDTA